jgi:hypothetical protein
MAFAVGTKVVLESESIARPPRTGKIEEVLREDPSPRYRIRWDDGHESIHVPAAGALREVPQPRTKSAAKRRQRATPR